MVPKKKTSKSKTGSRRAHQALKERVLSLCAKCKQPVLPHRVCLNCGYYQGREVVNVLARLEKKERKVRQKEIAAQEKQEAKTGKAEKPLSMTDLSRK